MGRLARIIVASTAEESREKVAGLLAASGFSVFRCCGGASDLRRAVSDFQDGIVIILGKLPGLNPEELLWDWGGRIQILFIARPQVLASCESPEIFRLPSPVSSQEITGAVQILEQLHQMHLPKRTGTEKETVEKAKQLLMQREGMTETQAHRHMQRYAMDHGIRMADYAALILHTSGEE